MEYPPLVISIEGPWEYEHYWAPLKLVYLAEFLVDWRDNAPMFTLAAIGVNSIVDYQTARVPFTADHMLKFLPLPVMPAQYVCIRMMGKGPATIIPVFRDVL